MASKPKIKIYFSEYFEIDPSALHDYGALNVSLVNDLPLFIDPFLLFNSTNAEYQKLHEEIIHYVEFLRDRALEGQIDPGLLRAWFTFPEVKQTWLGFSRIGNAGSGLGIDFASALNRNLNAVFPKFGEEPISSGSHLEKLCLLDDGVGKDNISDFTTNLVKDFLLRYTEKFALSHLREDQRKRIKVDKALFNYDTQKWGSATYDLPYISGDYVVLVPRDILTKEATWINRSDLLGNLDEIANAVSDVQLRAEINNYFKRKLKDIAGKKQPNEKQRREAFTNTLREFPALLDYYILIKEQHGKEAKALSAERVLESEALFIEGVRKIADKLSMAGFYDVIPDTLEEARKRVFFLKDVLEKQDGYRIFFVKDKKTGKEKSIHREEDLQILYRLTWFATVSDVNREVNNGRGPVDFKISRGSIDRSLVEFKLAKNTKLEQNLQKQVEIYQDANDTKKSLKVIVYFTKKELDKVKGILKRLKQEQNPNIILIDARNDNKPSASVA